MLLQDLLTASAVRERCGLIADQSAAGNTRWFRINDEHIWRCADLVARVCRQRYPLLDIPYHSRWRHFIIGGRDLWAHYCDQQLLGSDPASQTRTAIDLVFVSVLLDAGAGPVWRYTDPVTGKTLSRSEGLAAASVDLFFNHLAHYADDKGYYVDAQALQALTLPQLKEAFQHDAGNPLQGIEGRLELLHGLGEVLLSSDGATLTRPGDLYDVVLSAYDGTIAADQILHEVLKRFGSIWPSGLTQGGVHLGDTGLHSLVETDDETNHLVPFHKLSQWLSYSLIEPLQWSGIEVTSLDSLTGLPEYRNGGLFLDTGVITPVDPELLSQELSVDSEAVVEWRALTVVLLDRIAEEVRDRLQKSTDELPLSSVLQGGTWAAGRKLAADLRADGSPPIRLAVDGTVF